VTPPIHSKDSSLIDEREARSRANASLEEFLVFKELDDEKGSVSHGIVDLLIS